MSLDEFSTSSNSSANYDAVATQLPQVEPGIVLWWCPLERTVLQLEHASALLSPAEQTRAARFGTAALRARYIAGRSMLRLLLGRALGVEPATVPIVRGRRGRPQLDTASDIDFNVSHTQEVSLIGIARSARIGIDVERIDRNVNADGLCRKFLTSAERATCEPVGADLRRQRFLHYWTCKEALSKATGDGLSAPFRQLEIELNDVIRLVAGPAPYAPAHWRLRAAEVPIGFFGTVAIWSGRSMS